MNWIKLTDIKDLPKDRSFLLWDNHKTSGIAVYEAVIFIDSNNAENNKAGCPATGEYYNVEEFSHWCEIVGPDETKYGFENDRVEIKSPHPDFIKALDGIDYSKYIKEIVNCLFCSSNLN